MQCCAGLQGRKVIEHSQIIHTVYQNRGALTSVQGTVLQQIVRMFPNSVLLLLIIREQELKAGDLSIPSTFWELSLAKCSLSILHHCWNLKGSRWDDAFSHLSFCHHMPLEELFEIPKVIKWAVQPFSQVRNLSNRAFPEMAMQIPFLLVYVHWRTSVWTLQLLGELQGSLSKLWKWYCAFCEGGGRERELVW